MLAPSGGTQREGAIRCQTNEGMTVQVDCTVLFHVNPTNADDLWQKIGENYIDLIVRPYVHNVMRMVISRYSVEDAYATRRKLSQNIEITVLPGPGSIILNLPSAAGSAAP